MCTSEQADEVTAMIEEIKRTSALFHLLSEPEAAAGIKDLSGEISRRQSRLDEVNLYLEYVGARNRLCARYGIRV